MADPLEHFSGGTPGARNKLNRLTDEVDMFRNIRGDEQFIAVDRNPGGGLTIKLLINHVIPRIPKTQPGFSVQWGTLVNPWTPGTNAVTMQPCNAWNDPSPVIDPVTQKPVPPVVMYVQFPLAKAAQCLGAGAGDILAYVDIGADQPVLFNPPLLPDFRVGNTQNQGIYNGSSVAGKPNLVADWVRSMNF